MATLFDAIVAASSILGQSNQQAYDMGRSIGRITAGVTALIVVGWCGKKVWELARRRR